MLKNIPVIKKYIVIKTKLVLQIQWVIPECYIQERHHCLPLYRISKHHYLLHCKDNAVCDVVNYFKSYLKCFKIKDTVHGVNGK